MKKTILLLTLLFLINPSYSMVSETINGQDINAVKAGISKYILSKGGVVNHGNSYEANTIRAMEKIQEKYGLYTYVYSFNLTPLENGTKVDMILTKSLSGDEAQSVDSETERKVLENIIKSTRGRFLYGLGFEYEYYPSDSGYIKAPKGKETGIKITAVKYDALKKGLQTGDVIIKINGTSLKDIPLKEYSTILHAKSLTDSLELTYMRGGSIGTVTLSPRLSNTKIY